jgi:Putative transposase
MTLNADEFIRRFLMHVLPSGFQRIRYYGLLSNRYRKDKLARCRELIGMPMLEPCCCRPEPGRSMAPSDLYSRNGIPASPTTIR